MIRNYIFFILSVFFMVTQLYGQNLFMTKKGHLKIMTKVNDTIYETESQELSISLNYTTKQVRGTLNLKTLQTQIPELKEYLSLLENPLIITFEGTIPKDDFMVQSHGPIEFNWLITVNYNNGSFETVLKTTLQHIEEGSTFACRLSSFGSLAVNKLKLDELIPNLEDFIEIRFIQVILRV